MKATDKCIASVLNVILTILEEASVDIAKEAHEINVFALIRKILSSGQANLGLFTLKVLLDHSISMPLLEYEICRDRFNFTSSFDGVVYNENCLGLILDCWDLWKSSGSNTDRQNRESFKCFDAVLASLVALLQDTHTYRDMNVDILKQIDSTDQQLCDIVS